MIFFENILEMCIGCALGCVFGFVLQCVLGGVLELAVLLYAGDLLYADKIIK